MAENIDDLLAKIRARPLMYLSSRSIFSLKDFLGGYYYHNLSLSGCNTEKDKNFWIDFQNWIEKKYGSTTSQNWSSIINLYSNDEFEALENFFELYDKFRAYQ